MPRQRDIYLLSPKALSPETIAVTFAKTSRSPQSFREIALELTDEKSAQFHERWVVGYGHASVAEHAVLHLAVENVSRLAVECLESNRLASYTEKSTRYQLWDSDSYYTPRALAESLRGWRESFGSVQIYSRVALLELADDYALAELMAGTSLSNYLLYRFSPRLAALRPEGLEALQAEMEKKGYTPKVAGREQGS